MASPLLNLKYSPLTHTRALMFSFDHAKNCRLGNDLEGARESYEKIVVLNLEDVPEGFRENLVTAQFIFAKMCYYPLGGPKDLAKAKFYLKEASRGGSEKAKLLLNKHFFKEL